MINNIIILLKQITIRITFVPTFEMSKENLKYISLKKYCRNIIIFIRTP